MWQKIQPYVKYLFLLPGIGIIYMIVLGLKRSLIPQYWFDIVDRKETTIVIAGMIIQSLTMWYFIGKLIVILKQL